MGPLFGKKCKAVFLSLATVSIIWAGSAAGTPTAPSPSEGQETRSGMSLGQALLLGMVEGLTEYLPVSSTGHLLLAERVMNIGADSNGSDPASRREKTAADAYAICIQAGAIIAVLGLYRRRVGQMFRGVLGRDAAGLGLTVNTVAAFVPAAVIGLMLNGVIKEYLFGPWPVVLAWLVGGLAILFLAVSREAGAGGLQRGKPLDQLNWRMALAIGFAQCIAMWPGVSRSLVTILGGVLAGLSLSASVEFSFLLGLVTLGAATCFDALKHGHDMLQTFSLASLSAGLASAFIFAVLSVKWMVAYLNRHGMAVFGYYRVVLALVVGSLIALEIL